MIDDYVIKKLTPEDFTEAYALECRAFAFPWPETVFRQSLSNNTQRWALWHGSQLLGMAFLAGVKPEIELLNLAITPDKQGQGLGRFFLKRLITLLNEQGYEQCFLEVRASNIAAIKLYERLQFNQMGMRVGYYPTKRGREDAYLYAVELAHSVAFSDNSGKPVQD